MKITIPAFQIGEIILTNGKPDPHMTSFPIFMKFGVEDFSAESLGEETVQRIVRCIREQKPGSEKIRFVTVDVPDEVIQHVEMINREWNQKYFTLIDAQHTAGMRSYAVKVYLLMIRLVHTGYMMFLSLSNLFQRLPFHKMISGQVDGSHIRGRNQSNP